jgi:four helix bundle protein
MLPYERLTAWQLCYDLALEVYRSTAGFPKHELYGVTSQARRAAFSAAANIAEGSAKRGAREFRRFLDIAIGSLAELAFILRLARDLEYLTSDQWNRLDELRRRAGFLTWRLYRSISGKGHPSTGAAGR